MTKFTAATQAPLVVLVAVIILIACYALGTTRRNRLMGIGSAAHAATKTGHGLTRTSNAIKPGAHTELATFAAGCFWGVEQDFRSTPGVIATAVGYAGGHTSEPTYKQVCSDGTGHAEAVQVEFDPTIISYDKLLDVFWNLHDPTTLNRQGPDYGSQYRSVIFYHTPEQKTEAEKSKARLDRSGKMNRPVVTEIAPADRFWFAEDYHQQYSEKRGISGCRIH